MNIGDSGFGFYLGFGRKSSIFIDKLFYNLNIELHAPINLIDNIEYLDMEYNNELRYDARMKDYPYYVQYSFGLNYEFRFSKIFIAVLSAEFGFNRFSDMNTWERPTGDQYYYDDNKYKTYDEYETISSKSVKYKINDLSGYFFNVGSSFLIDF